MCGIAVIWGAAIKRNPGLLVDAVRALGPRGPDASTNDYYTLNENEELGIGFTRLHIQGSTIGAEQPYKLPDQCIVLCNGEIFNSEMLIQEAALPVPTGSSDCAVIPALLKRGGLTLADVSRQLDGDFAIVVLDLSRQIVHVSRDPYGVRPLFYARGEDWTAIVSELKALPSGAHYVEQIIPGTVRNFTLGEASSSTVIWHQTPWLKHPFWHSSVEGLAAAGASLRYALEEAVMKRLTTVRDVGACLSGGLDSSLVAAIAAEKLGKIGRKLHTYTVGMSNSPDLEHARLVAKHIGSIHHEWIVSPEECLALIPEVIRAIETFDITTVRASVGNYLVGQLVARETPTVKVILNGDGSDEALGGYLYMQEAPDNIAFEQETDRLLQEIYRYDVLRSERSMAAHGLESRSPFLDRQFIAVARSLPTDVLRSSPAIMEKTILRTAFLDTGLLPNQVLWRRKEAFSDGISSTGQPSWYELTQAEAAKHVPKMIEYRGVNPPQTVEAAWYRQLWSEHYPESAAHAVAPAMWMPRFIKGATDPSARTLKLYTQGQPKQSQL